MIKPIPVPVDSKREDWPRLVSNAIGQLQRTQKGAVRFESGVLQYYDGADWQNVP